MSETENGYVLAVIEKVIGHYQNQATDKLRIDAISDSALCMNCTANRALVCLLIRNLGRVESAYLLSMLNLEVLHLLLSTCQKWRQIWGHPIQFLPGRTAERLHFRLASKELLGLPAPICKSRILFAMKVTLSKMDFIGETSTSL